MSELKQLLDNEKDLPVRSTSEVPKQPSTPRTRMKISETTKQQIEFPPLGDVTDNYHVTH